MFAVEHFTAMRSLHGLIYFLSYLILAQDSEAAKSILLSGASEVITFQVIFHDLPYIKVIRSVLGIDSDVQVITLNAGRYTKGRRKSCFLLMLLHFWTLPFRPLITFT